MLTLDTIDSLCLVFQIHVQIKRYLNKLGIKYQSYSKLAKTNTFDQKNMHMPQPYLLLNKKCRSIETKLVLKNEVSFKINKYQQFLTPYLEP